MNLKLVTFKVRGLNHLTSVPTLQNYISSISALDVLCIQETKLRGASAASLGHRLWPQAQCWSVEASQGYANNLDGTSAGKGGIVTLLAPRWVSFVSQSGVILGVVGKSITTNPGYFSTGRFLMGKGLNVYCFHNWGHL
jgi:hypothetical protein